MDSAKSSMVNNPRSIIIYPEGTRSNNGSIRQFKKGGLVLAINMDLPVVPVALCGTRECLGEKKYKLKKNTIEMRIGKPIKTHTLRYEDRNKFAENVRDEVVKLKSEWQNQPMVFN